MAASEHSRHTGWHDVEPEEVGAETEASPESEIVEAATYAKMVQPEPTSEQRLPLYQIVEVAGGHPDHFYAPASRKILAGQLVHIINMEGPIADAALFRKVARAWGLARTGNRIEELLRSLLPAMVVRTFEAEGDAFFYWPVISRPTQWQEFRVAGEADDSRRPLSEICSEELANLAIFILSEHGATSVSELARTICRLQGITRTTADAEARIIRALQVGRAKEFVQLANGAVSLTKRL